MIVWNNQISADEQRLPKYISKMLSILFGHYFGIVIICSLDAQTFVANCRVIAAQFTKWLVMFGSSRSWHSSLRFALLNQELIAYLPAFLFDSSRELSYYPSKIAKANTLDELETSLRL